MKFDLGADVRLGDEFWHIFWRGPAGGLSLTVKPLAWNTYKASLCNVEALLGYSRL